MVILNIHVHYYFVNSNRKRWNKKKKKKRMKINRDTQTINCLYVFVLCVVIELCNISRQNKHLFNLMFYLNTSCLLHVLKIICSSSGGSFVYAVFYVMFFMR
jgi:hypothetical protein